MTSFPMCCLECCPAQMSVPTQGFFLRIFLPLKGTVGEWMFQIKLREHDKATAFWWDDVRNLVGAHLVGKTKCQWAKALGQRRVEGEQSNLKFIYSFNRTIDTHYDSCVNCSHRVQQAQPFWCFGLQVFYVVYSLDTQGRYYGKCVSGTSCCHVNLHTADQPKQMSLLVSEEILSACSALPLAKLWMPLD